MDSPPFHQVSSNVSMQPATAISSIPTYLKLIKSQLLSWRICNAMDLCFPSASILAYNLPSSRSREGLEGGLSSFMETVRLSKRIGEPSIMPIGTMLRRVRCVLKGHHRSANIFSTITSSYPSYTTMQAGGFIASERNRV